MLCQKCKKQTATTQVKRTVNGVSEEYFLCRDCAAEMGFAGFMNPFSTAGFFNSFFPSAKGETSLSPVKRCDKCNSSLADITNSGKVGCAHCYTVFENSLAPIITKIHGTNHHWGKLPHGASYKSSEEKDPVAKKESELDTLKAQLKQAIDLQEYEQAAVLRDKIKALEESEN